MPRSTSVRRNLAPVAYAAERTGLSVYTLYALARSGVLPPGVVVRLGRRLRFDPEALDDWLRAGGASHPGGWRRSPRPRQQAGYP
jgi:excisionase family DNA binding protein